MPEMDASQPHVRSDELGFEYSRWLSSAPPGEEVVISGMSGRLPDSRNIHEFRDNLFSKTDMVNDDDRRWKLDHPEVPQRSAKIRNIDHLDAGYFGVHHRQANVMDPMMRVLLETAVEAIMDAGMNPSELESSRTGVFTGVSWSDMENSTLVDVTERQKFALTGYLRSLNVHRVSYFLKLKGPACIVDTACSSSLNALDLAFRAIRSGQCDNAIISGSNLLLHPGNTLQFFRLGVLSSEGVCRVFDQDANGYVRGESIASIFLQKAKNARRIYAQIINTKVNSDGFKEQGITFPSTLAQKQLMTEIYDESGIHPSELSFLEAHGTGTQVGDPQEVEAIDHVLARKRDKPLLVGSVKSSIGHTEPASGVCSIIKVLIAMETGLIAPNINLKQTKAGMEGFEQGRLKVVLDLTELEGDEALVGVNNFGFGGNNCHTILKRFKKKKVDGGIPKDDVPRLVCVSGRTEEAVLSLLNDVNSRKLDAEHVGLLHQIYKKNIANHIYRGFTIASKNGPLKTSSKFFSFQHKPLYVYFGQFERSFKLLGSYLMHFPIFKKTISRIDNILATKNVNISDAISKDQIQEDNLLGAIAVQAGLVDVLKSLELIPTAVYGDSWGKLVSAYYYDVITIEETVLTVYKISQKQSDFESNMLFDAIPEFKSLLKSVTKRRDRYFCKTPNLPNLEFRGHSLSHETLLNMPKNSLVLNVSDQQLDNKDVLLVEGNLVNFLEVLGRLYECGHNPQLHKLYPEIVYPVSRGTPMISPMVKWDHDRSWFTYKFTQFIASEIEQMDYNVSNGYEEFKHIAGHVIDGRNLFPAAEYLHLVWQTLAQSWKLAVIDFPVVFENCKFIRAVTMPKTGFIKLFVTIQRGCGNFEVVHMDQVVVTGRVSHCSNTVISGMFKGIARCDIGASTGLLKWEDNWTTFMDNMLQMNILQVDSRLLYVPVGIRKLTIDPVKHHQIVESFKDKESLIPVHVYKESNIIKSGGIEIRGLTAKSISKKKPRWEPVLEKYEFVPNQESLDLSQLIRVNIQIILENSLENHFKAVELLEGSSELLLPLVCKVLDDVPVVTPDLIISTKTVLDPIPGVKIEQFVLTPESNLLLIVATKLLQNPISLKQVLNSLHPKGFVLTREEVVFEISDLDNIEVVTQYTTAKEKLILFKKSEEKTVTKFVEVSSNNFEWLSQLQDFVKSEANVVVYGQNREPDGLIGLVNCLRREPEGHKVKCFLMMDETPDFDPELPFYGNQVRKNLAVNIYKSGKWGTYRHLLLEELQEVECEYCFGDVSAKGDLSSMRWLEEPPIDESRLPETQVLIYNYYSAINFKDIMLASGRISAEPGTNDRIEQKCVIGFEFAGLDPKGRRVMGIVDNRAIATHVRGNSQFLWEVPESWSLEDAATIPVVYSTVMYALLLVVDLKPKSTVLIHSGTGGIGLAALNVCLHHQFEIYVTVGTQDKRDYLRKHYPQIPESHIGNSRDTSFEEMIKAGTNNRGVDAVLNSLSEDKLRASVRCLARGGRFLEIGKFDLANDSSLSLLLLERGASYHGIMLDQIFKNSAELKAKLVDALYKGVRDGYVKPLPRVVFGRDELVPAFKYMTTGKHIGKVLVKVRDEGGVRGVGPKRLFSALPRFNCDLTKSYVIIGGLGGVGLELADWLILRDARKLVLVSRSGVQTGYQAQRIRLWRSYGVEVEISTRDVTTKQGCLDLIREATELGSIDAIFNLAVVLKDALLKDQTDETFRLSLAPKARTTTYLDQITREICPHLRYFVIFSSVSCGRGNAGQTNYGMANSIMERICERRKRDGFPALAIQWGAIGDVGLVAKMQKENKELVIGGTLQQKISSCLEVLDRFLKQDNPIVASMLVAEKSNRSHGATSAVEAVANVLGIKDIKTVSQHATLAELGMDSMMGTEVIQLLEKEFEIYITTKDVRSLNFAKLTEIESEKRNVGEEKSLNKTQQGTDLLLQFIPDNQADSRPIVKLSCEGQDNEGQTVLVFPGIEGVFTLLEGLVKSLQARVLGVQYSYQEPEISVEEIAKTSLPHIEENISKDESLTLIGYSFGVSVCLEVLSLLENRGYSGKVISIDGSPTYIRSSVLNSVPGDTEAEFQTNLLYKILAVLIPVDLLAPYKEKFLKCSDLDERCDLALTLIPSEVVDRQKLDKQAMVALYKRFKAALNYEFCHDKIRSKAYLFKAKYPIVNEDEDYHLSMVFEHSVQVATVDGDHVTMLNQSELIKDINKLIACVDDI
ncbi:hypothetical protein GEV33_009449 [Tenebrio molitor]|uniref:Fatty acid synthase n=1 Tax=Tenebrio molitor TaxID=7067 RepID=A0A8J6HF83_TENMO|nr:hypothetical protein GEV33_009449 [Tenebrio molitor]